VKGKADAIDLEKGLIQAKYRGKTNNNKWQDWKEWIPAESLTNLPPKEKGAYKFHKPPHYWKEGRYSLFEHYGKTQVNRAFRSRSASVFAVLLIPHVNRGRGCTGQTLMAYRLSSVTCLSFGA